MQPFVGKMAQVVVQIHAIGRGKQRQEVFAQREREIAAFGDFLAVLQRFGDVGEAGSKIGGGKKMLAGGKVVRAFGVDQRPAACDAHASIVGFVVFALQELGGMGGNHRQLQGLGDFQAA